MPFRFDDLIQRDPQNPLSHLPANKSQFSFQDVVELTILHAQQMQLLQTTMRSDVKDSN